MAHLSIWGTKGRSSHPDCDGLLEYTNSEKLDSPRQMVERFLELAVAANTWP